MPSNCMIVCPSCRMGRKGMGAGVCARCGVEELNFGKRLTLPKKNNDRAWKRILNGEFRWNFRKYRAAPDNQIWLPGKPGQRRRGRIRGINKNIDLGK